MKVIKIKVFGKVQGVWFRKYTQEKALELKLIGYVINKNDGTVYIEIIDNSPKVNIFLDWLENEGSPLSNVTKIEFVTSKKKFNFNTFKIL